MCFYKPTKFKKHLIYISLIAYENINAMYNKA